MNKHRREPQHSSAVRPGVAEGAAGCGDLGGRGRRWIALAAGAFVIVQLLLPLRYYLGFTGEDERFAWRMFSSASRRQCEASLYQTVERDGRRVEEQVPAAVLKPWQNMLRRQRESGIEKLMRAYTRRPGVVGVRYKLSCTELDGTPAPSVQWWLGRGESRMRRLGGGER